MLKTEIMQNGVDDVTMSGEMLYTGAIHNSLTNLIVLLNHAHLIY